MSGLIDPTSKQPIPSSPELAGQAALLAFVTEAKKTIDTLNQLQSKVKNLRTAGESFDEISKKLGQAGVIGKEASQAMEGYYRSLAELKKLGIGEFFSDFKNNMSSLGRSLSPLSGSMLTVGAAIGALAYTFKVLENAGVEANKAIANMAIQSGTFGKGSTSGLMGGLSRVGSVDAQRDYHTAAIQFVKMGYSAEQAGQAMSMIATQLPRDVIGKAAPSFATATAAIARQLGISLEDASSLLTTAYRRGVTSAEGLAKMFGSLQKTAEAAGMSTSMYTQSFTELWSQTRQFGGTTKEVDQMMRRFGSAIEKGILSTSDVGRLYAGSKEASTGSIAGLAELAKSLGVKGADQMFGTSSDPKERTGHYLGYLQSKDFDVDKLAQMYREIFTKQAEKMSGGIGGPDAERFYKDQIRQSLGPAIGFGLGRQESERLFQAVDQGRSFIGGQYGEAPGKGKPLAELKTPEEVNKAIMDAFKEYTTNSESLSRTTMTVAKNFEQLAEALKLTGSSFVRTGWSSSTKEGAAAVSDTIRDSSVLSGAARLIAGGTNAAFVSPLINVAITNIAEQYSASQIAYAVSEQLKVELARHKRRGGT